MGVLRIDDHWTRHSVLVKCFENTLSRWTSGTHVNLRPYWVKESVHQCSETRQIHVSLLFFSLFTYQEETQTRRSSPRKRMGLHGHVTPQASTSQPPPSASTPTSHSMCLICRGRPTDRSKKNREKKIWENMTSVILQPSEQTLWSYTTNLTLQVLLLWISMYSGLSIRCGRHEPATQHRVTSEMLLVKVSVHCILVNIIIWYKFVCKVTCMCIDVCKVANHITAISWAKNIVKNKTMYSLLCGATTIVI